MHKKVAGKMSEEKKLPSKRITKTTNVVNFQAFQQQNSEIVSKLDNSLQELETNIEQILSKNELLLSPENYNKLNLKESQPKGNNECSELQKATVDYIVNLRPDNIDHYRRVKNDYIECEKKFKFNLV